MKRYYIVLLFVLSMSSLRAMELEDVLQYAEVQLQEAFNTLLAINTSYEAFNAHKINITHRILDVVTERQSIRLLHFYHDASANQHIERLRKIYQNKSLHPLLQIARNMQQALTP